MYITNDVLSMKYAHLLPVDFFYASEISLFFLGKL